MFSLRNILIVSYYPWTAVERQQDWKANYIWVYLGPENCSLEDTGERELKICSKAESKEAGLKRQRGDIQ